MRARLFYELISPRSVVQLPKLLSSHCRLAHFEVSSLCNTRKTLIFTPPGDLHQTKVCVLVDSGTQPNAYF